MSNLIELAKQIALAAHSGQKDRAGKPFCLHLQKVANLVDTEEEKAVAWLHDILEDTDYSSLMLLHEGIPGEIINIVEILTKRPGEDYLNDYLARVKTNAIATKVKLADLTHNSDFTRLLKITQKDLDRRDKYIKAQAYLDSFPSPQV